MRNKRVILHRAVMVVAVMVVAGIFAGCSSVEPTDAWTEQDGKVTGTVRSDTGAELAGIEVWLWAELGAEGREVWYQTETDVNGAYELDGVEMATQHSFDTSYWLGVNRDAERTNSIAAAYGTWLGSVSVPKGDTCVWNAVIEYIEDGPDDPETYVEG